MKFNPLYFLGLFLFLYACYSFSQVAKVVNPFGPHAPAKPLTMEEAAPEIVQLRDGFRALAAKARAAEKACVDYGRVGMGSGSEPLVRGKALIWSVAKDDVAREHVQLPADIRATDLDGEVTVFLMVEEKSEQAVNYNYDIFSGGGASGVKGYRTDTIVYVVGMPGAKPIGRYFIYGVDPPGAARLKPGETEVVSSWNYYLKQWVEGVVRGKEWRESAWERKNLEGQEGFGRLVAEAKEVLPQCKANGGRGPFPPLPKKALLWCYDKKAQYSGLHQAHHFLADRQKAGQNDTDVVVFLVTAFELVRVARGGGPQNDIERTELTTAVVVFPGPQPVGQFTVRCEETPAGRYSRPGPPPGRQSVSAVGRGLLEIAGGICRTRRGPKHRQP